MSNMVAQNQTLTDEEQARLFGELRARGQTPRYWDLLLGRLAGNGQVERLRKDEAEGKEDAWEAFVEVADEEVDYQHNIAASVGGTTRAPRQQEGGDVSVAVGEKDRRAAELCTELLAQEAADDPVLVGFREREFDGGTLTPEAAENHLRDCERERPRGAALVVDLPRSLPHQLLLDEPDREATLGDVAAYLAWRYPWGTGGAAWFVLTGEPPAVEPASVALEADNTFTIKIHPWATKESLNAARDAMFTPWVGECRPPKGEALDLVELVLEHTDGAGRRLKTWEELREIWNARYPARKMSTYSAVSRAYNRARKRLAPRRL